MGALPPAPILPTPSFVNDADGLNVNQIVADMIAEFEADTGQTLYPAQPERLFINRSAYRESLVRNAIQAAGLQNLVAFAAYPMLDYLAQNVGVTRLGSVAASATILFTLANALSVPLTIPAGTLVGTYDGAYQFATASAITIAAGATTGSVLANCTVTGTGANGYAIGQVNVMLNPDALIASVANTTESSGGSAPETDSHLRTRIQAAPNQFSVAGPVGAYRFFALSASPDVVDVLVVSPVPGTVDVYLLTGPILSQPAASPNSVGIASSAIIAAANALLLADTVRPLTDTVNVLAVTEVDYTITVTVTLYSDADPVAVAAAVNLALQEFAINNASRIQRNVILSQILAAIVGVAGVYEAVLSAPSADVILTAGQWANCIAINITTTVGTEHS